MGTITEPRSNSIRQGAHLGRSRRSISQQNGSVALAAIGTLAIVLVMAVGVMALAGNSLQASRNHSRTAALNALAEAGIQYGYWQTAWQGASMPFTENNHALGPGSFSVTVTDNSALLSSTVKIVSTATIGSASVTMTKVMSSPPPSGKNNKNRYWWDNWGNWGDWNDGDHGGGDGGDDGWDH